LVVDQKQIDKDGIKLVKCVVISRLGGPWLMVGKVNGGALSNKIASADRASVSEVSLADWQKVLFV
jgi:hypothetical protein